jgi:fluoroquinolone resistance protein
MIAEDQLIEGSDFSGTSLADHAYINCTFHNCNFTECILWNTKFTSCTFKACNLSLLKLEGCRLQEVQFIDCKIVGAEFFKCEKRFFSIQAIHSSLHYCNFSGLTMKHTSFQESRLTECQFIDTNLTEANFTMSDLPGTLFHNSDLTKANFCGAKNYEIDVRNNKIKKAKFSFPEAIGLLHGFDIDIKL